MIASSKNARATASATIAFSDPADYDTYEIVCTARLNEPDPYEVDNFIRTQISLESQEELREHLQ